MRSIKKKIFEYLGENRLKGLVVKNISNKYTVYAYNKIYTCVGMGKLKTNDIIKVGDKVEFEKLDNTKLTGRITSILPRKNNLIRPPVANIDLLGIVVSKSPAPDFMLIDKLIVFALINNITPVLCINKDDLNNNSDREYILSQYKNVVKKIVFVSAKTMYGIAELKAIITNKTIVFAGQSAVGKSSLINVIMEENILTGDLSEKTQRGKHTTRHCQLYFKNKIKIMDTAGFSNFEIDCDYHKLALLYPDFPVNKCKYDMCSHTKEEEKDCAVKQLVKAKKINQERYNRYVKLYNELKNGKPQKINYKRKGSK